METNPTTALAPTTPPATIPQPLMPLAGNELQYWSSLDRTKEADKKLLTKAILNPDHEIGPEGIPLVNVVHVYADVATKIDAATGEAKELPRVVLIDDQGKTYQTFSEWLTRDLGKLFAVVGPPPYSPPKPFMVKSQRTKNGNLMYRILPADEPQANGKKK